VQRTLRFDIYGGGSSAWQKGIVSLAKASPPFIRVLRDC
jgi:hypothetical protein